MEKDFWYEAINAMSYHTKESDEGAEHSLIRNINEYFEKEFVKFPIRENTNIICEKWNTECFCDISFKHDKTKPKCFDGSVILFENFGKYFVVDGNNRINFWCRQKNNDEHSVLIISLKK